ncbi:MAG: hypothetical protein AB2L14_32060 [Candidatus Xenobiia bacterium LiM19]
MKRHRTFFQNLFTTSVAFTLCFAIFFAVLSGCKCKKENEYRKAVSTFLSAWQKGEYEKAYELLTPSLCEIKELSEFKAEIELIAIRSFRLLHEKRNQGLVWLRYSIDAAWKEKGNEPEPSAIDFIVLETKEGWKIGAFEEVLKAEEKVEFKEITLLLRDENKIKIAFKDETGKVLEMKEISLSPDETVLYTCSPEEKLGICRENLKKISLALEMYGADCKGSYPHSLSILTPHYLERFPLCPSGGNYRYQKEAKLKTFTIQCCRDAHREAGVTGNFPAYLPVQGVIEK